MLLPLSPPSPSPFLFPGTLPECYNFAEWINTMRVNVTRLTAKCTVQAECTHDVSYDPLPKWKEKQAGKTSKRNSHGFQPKNIWKKSTANIVINQSTAHTHSKCKLLWYSFDEIQSTFTLKGQAEEVCAHCAFQQDYYRTGLGKEIMPQISVCHVKNHRCDCYS